MKFMNDLKHFLDQIKYWPITRRCKESNKIYWSVTLHFYDLFDCRGCQMDVFFYTLYKTSFRFLREMEEIQDSKYLQLLKKRILPYRKVYESYREKQWGTNQWTSYLGRDILNIISSYLY
jgi:hypothetical protein